MGSGNVGLRNAIPNRHRPSMEDVHTGGPKNVTYEGGPGRSCGCRSAVPGADRGVKKPGYFGDVLYGWSMERLHSEVESGALSSRGNSEKVKADVPNSFNVRTR